MAQAKHIRAMITNPKPLTRDAFAKVMGGLFVIYDCLECFDGVYIGGCRPHCSRCGSPMPDDILEVARSLQSSACSRSRDGGPFHELARLATIVGFLRRCGVTACFVS